MFRGIATGNRFLHSRVDQRLLSIWEFDAADDADRVLLIRAQAIRRLDVDVRFEGELGQANFLLCFLDFGLQRSDRGTLGIDRYFRRVLMHCGMR